MSVNIFQLIETAPVQQVTRCKMVYHAVLNGQRSDAIFWLQNAIEEEQGTKFAHDAGEVLMRLKESAKQ